MVRIAVCDDEPDVTELISGMVREYLPDCEIKEFDSGEELLADGEKFDILFLDIQMDGINGIQAAAKVREKDEDAIIIFITGVKEYVFDAFDVTAFHYLLKPIKKTKMQEVLDRAVKQIDRRTGEKRQLFIQKRGKSMTVDVDDILFLENDMHKVVVHTTGEVFTFYGVMSELEEKVGPGFYRCHRGYLVNMAYISEYDAENIYLTTGDRIYLAREKYQDFVKHYMRYMRNGGISHA